MITRSLKTQPFRSQRILKPSTPSRNRNFQTENVLNWVKNEISIKNSFWRGGTPSIHGKTLRSSCVHHTQDSYKSRGKSSCLLYHVDKEKQANSQFHSFIRKGKHNKHGTPLQRQRNMFLSWDTLENGLQTRKR